MSVRSIFFVFAVLPMLGRDGTSQSLCKVEVKASVEAGASGVTLADLLQPESCAALRTAAAGVRLGAVPLEGSPRVLRGSEVRERIEAITAVNRHLLGTMQVGNIPQRITVRRAGPRARCADIEAQLFSAADRAQGPGSDLNCGAADGIAQGATVRQIGQAWDPATRNWIVTARCPSAAECVPFALRVGPELHSAIPSAANESETARPQAPAVVHPGQRAMLLWDQDGIRVVVPSVCLDAGAVGDTIRTRIVRSRQVLRAVVLAAGELKAAS